MGVRGESGLDEARELRDASDGRDEVCLSDEKEPVKL